MPLQFAGSVLDTSVGYLQHIQQMEAQERNAAIEREYRSQRDAIADERYIEERDYNRALQQTIFDREDSSIQRAVQDAGAAGLSPLAVAGNGASSGAIVGQSTANASRGGTISPASVPMFASNFAAAIKGWQDLQVNQQNADTQSNLANAQIAFNNASLNLQQQKIGMDFQLANAEMFNKYTLLAKELDLKQKGYDETVRQFDETQKRLADEFKEMQRQFDTTHGLNQLDTIWSNINGSVSAGTGLIKSITDMFNPFKTLENAWDFIFKKQPGPKPKR